MPNCVRTFCEGLTGRRSSLCNDMEGHLLSLQRPPSSAIRSAELGLQQVGLLRQACDFLGPVVATALSETPSSAGAAGEVTLAVIRAKLAELEAMLRVAAAGPVESPTAPSSSRASRRSRRIREVASCIASVGDERTWRPGHLVITREGLRFERKEDNTKPAGPGNSQVGARKVLVIPWYDVQQVVAHNPEQKARSSTSRLFEAELELRRPPGKLRLQFGGAAPLRTLDLIWQEEKETGDGLAGIAAAPAESPAPAPPVEEAPKGSPMEACGGLLEDLRRTSGLPGCEQKSCHRAPVPLPRGQSQPLAKVYEQLARDDSDCAIARMWQARNVTEWDVRSWEPFGTGTDIFRRVTFRLPLRPMPMAPKSTRVALIYHIRRGSTWQEPVVLTEVTRSLDVPYSTTFTVHIQHIFSLVGEEVEVDNTVGVCWTGRCMVKSLVESSSRSEAVISSKALVDNILDCVGYSPTSSMASSKV